MSEKRGKKRPKSYYIKCAKKPRQNAGGRLDVGMKGFLVTCNKREKDAVREMYNLLNEYADQIYGKEQIGRKDREKGGNSSSSEDSGEEDIEKAMLQEIAEIKEKNKTERRFQNTNTKVSNCIFIRTTLDDPCALAHHILTDLSASKQQKTRSAIRLLPISDSCKAFDKDIKKMAEQLFKPYFETQYGHGLTYTTIFKTRNNSSIGRESILPLLGQIIKDLNPLHRVNHNTPDYTVLVEIVGNICCMSVVRDFFKFRKYNLQEVVKTRTEQVRVYTKSESSTETEKDMVSKAQENSKLNLPDGEQSKDNLGEQECQNLTEESRSENVDGISEIVSSCNSQNGKAAAEGVELKDEIIMDVNGDNDPEVSQSVKDEENEKCGEKSKDSKNASEEKLSEKSEDDPESKNEDCIKDKHQMSDDRVVEEVAEDGV